MLWNVLRGATDVKRASRKLYKEKFLGNGETKCVLISCGYNKTNGYKFEYWKKGQFLKVFEYTWND